MAFRVGEPRYGSTGLDEFLDALERDRSRMYTHVQRIPLHSLVGWRGGPHADVIVHESGRFFTVEGVDVRIDRGAVPRWSQPIMNQPEIGILGLIVRQFDGVRHYLMQLKAEPGNRNGIQVSPTVQATHSNYTRVHRGSAVPYLDYFTNRRRHQVVADVRQSEQGSWFLRKRNRNMILEVGEEVEVADGFYWLTITQIHQLLRVEDLVNMDARSVLACLPLAETMPATVAPDRDDFVPGLLRSWSGNARSLHTTPELLSWITEARMRTEIRLRTVPLNRLPRWRYDGEKISHETGRFFEVIGVRVEAGGREVDGWDQPMFTSRGTGVIAFLVTMVDDVLHVLVHARVEPGYSDVAELAPTVQCTPENYDAGYLPRPPFLDAVLQADASMIRYDTILSEEGGRFFRTHNRYMIVETCERHSHPDFRWMTLHQLTELLRHSHYVNVQARSLLACMAALTTPPVRVGHDR